MAPGSPHPRGDGPASTLFAHASTGFSPPAWGWSAVCPAYHSGYPVLPTRVGMVRICRFTWGKMPCSPHPRGDGPNPGTIGSKPFLFSPPAWGWSDDVYKALPEWVVLPTRVG